MKVRIVLTIIVVLFLQLSVSGLVYTFLSDSHAISKNGIILLINWFIAIIALFYIIKEHEHVFFHLRELNSKYKTNEILFTLLKKLAKVESTEKMYKYILDAASEAIHSSTSGSILMSKFGKMTFVASQGFDQSYLDLIEINLQETAIYKLTNGKMDKPIIVDDILEFNVNELENSKIDLFDKAGVGKMRSSISAPIIINNNVVGVLNLDSEEVGAFKESDISVLEMFALDVGKFVQMHQVMDENRKMSRYDDLTRIYNRGYCTRMIKEYMEAGESFILMSIDLNGLKQVNDLYGHDVGDLLIKSFVDDVKLFLNDNVLFGRYGGDEFILVFKEYSYVEAVVVVDDVKNYFVNHTVRNCEHPINITFSYGVVEHPAESRDYDQILKLADDRMYRQKRRLKS
jgi:diguanylate cyclase (GGDEF)-like protein